MSAGNAVCVAASNSAAPYDGVIDSKVQSETVNNDEPSHGSRVCCYNKSGVLQQGNVPQQGGVSRQGGFTVQVSEQAQRPVP
jgi:hypothetical protein